MLYVHPPFLVLLHRLVPFNGSKRVFARWIHFPHKVYVPAELHQPYGTLIKDRELCVCYINTIRCGEITEMNTDKLKTIKCLFRSVQNVQD